MCLYLVLVGYEDIRIHMVDRSGIVDNNIVIQCVSMAILDIRLSIVQILHVVVS